MFSNFFVALISGLGIMGWVYMRASRSTGGNKQNALIAGAAVGLVGFIIVFTLLNLLFH